MNDSTQTISPDELDRSSRLAEYCEECSLTVENTFPYGFEITGLGSNKQGNSPAVLKIQFPDEMRMRRAEEEGKAA
jgi:hypothetical protein